MATRTTRSSACQLQYDLGISYPTAWSWCHKIRKAMEDRDTRYTLRGMVELHDTYIGGKGKPGKRGRGAHSKVPVLAAVESRPEGCDHVVLRKLESLTSYCAKSILTHKLQQGSLILSAYQVLSEELTLCLLAVSNGRRALEIFPDVHRVIARLKTLIRGTHSHVSSKHLNRYPAEFSYRFNRRFKQRRDTSLMV
ncbi:MAG: IS1595 family transposase [Candidatus Hodarchaeota archaeon]